jgi:hypothetical protein
MTMQLETGKVYIDRNGRKIGPMSAFGDMGEPVFTDESRINAWNRDGTYIQSYTGVSQRDLVAEWVDEFVGNTPEMDTFGELPDIKQSLLDEAGKIVNGARRKAYGTPEQNFERIARFWQSYFENTGRTDVKITAADVSPMMRLMKEARLCETPDHYDSFVDIVGYTLTGAEVNGVNKPKGA